MAAVVDEVVHAVDPVEVILFGSVARGEDGPDSDIDLLVVFEHIEPDEKRPMMARIRSAIDTFAPIDVLVTDPAEMAERHDDVGSVLYWPAREGRSVYRRPVSTQSDPDEWLRYAHDDLAAARLLLTDAGCPRAFACFHAQQAAEKALKASLVGQLSSSARRTTSPCSLALQSEPVRSEVAGLELQRLQQWALDDRYPADVPEASAGEAGEVVGVASRLVDVVADALAAGP